jgi:uncharacterized protein (TIGR01244 family)
LKTTSISPRLFPLFVFALLGLVLAAGCAGNSPAPESGPPVLGMAPPDSVSDLPGFSGRIYLDGRVYISGQPAEEALRALPARDVTAVINLRTPKEMSDTTKVAFDEAALVDSLGMDYIEIPQGGKDHPYGPGALEAFAETLDKHTGPVLLHCASGGRASHLWAAYLARYQGWTVTDAYARGEAIGIGIAPFAKFLDVELEVVEKNN